MNSGRRVSVVGLGYVGLPVAVAFGRKGKPVVAFDIDEERIAELKAGHDRTREISADDLDAAGLVFTADLNKLREADFHIVAVPTPIGPSNEPDLGALLAASRTVGSILKRGDIVVFESTVFPGATRNHCVPVLEAESGLAFGEDFSVGYSPERINPGDKVHRFETITKVVSGSDAATLDIVSEVYGAVVDAGVHRAPTIETAEAAKVIENTQRDLNIALINELSLICRRLGIDTHDVLQAANTKWNFLPFVPGLVGGHCIGVDPYYLTYCAERANYHPEVILAGRRLNDRMSSLVAHEVVKALLADGDVELPLSITVLGISFKENVPDVRNSKIGELVQELRNYGANVQVYDPVVDAETAKRETGADVSGREDLSPAQAIVVGAAHQQFVEGGWALVQDLLIGGRGFVFDIKGMLDRTSCPEGIVLWRL